MQGYTGLTTIRGKPSGLVAKNTHTEGFWKSVHRSVRRGTLGISRNSRNNTNNNTNNNTVPFRKRVTKMMPIGVPRVPYRTPKESSWQWVDIWNCLYRERIIFLSKPVDEELGNQLVATMLYLDSEDQKPLNLYINCSGGQVVPCLAIHDTMRHIRSPVGTVGFGGCMGMSGFLLAVGERGRRNVLQNTHVMIHHPSGTARGQASDMNREAQELLRIRDYMDMILASSTGQPYDKVAYDFSRNKYFDAQEALEYGVVDNIVKPARAMAQL
mmetsp:Transcript_1375/g.4480  ORF Transcript_1375/g.4480 Transcript_1375/m.4480 type:complete len:270 (-) Transcript_1375:25-834(-)